MAIDRQSDRNNALNAAVEKQTRKDDTDRVIEQPSDTEAETALKSTKPVETSTDPFAGFGSFN